MHKRLYTLQNLKCTKVNCLLKKREVAVEVGEAYWSTPKK